ATRSPRVRELRVGQVQRRSSGARAARAVGRWLAQGMPCELEAALDVEGFLRFAVECRAQPDHSVVVGKAFTEETLGLEKCRDDRASGQSADDVEVAPDRGHGL